MKNILHEAFVLFHAGTDPSTVCFVNGSGKSGRTLLNYESRKKKIVS